METLIVLSGPIGVGKSTFGKALVELFDVAKVSTREFIREKTGCDNERGALQEAGDRLDRETGGKWVADAVERALQEKEENQIFLLDSVRIKGQIDALKQRFSGKVFHTHLHADLQELERRYLTRAPELKEFSTYAEASKHGTEAQVNTLARLANLVLDADYASAETLATTAMAILGKPIKQVERLVDVIIGGQYGSEGKGNICAHIAKRYGALVRIGGPNAGHRVFKPPYKYVQLPSGTGSNSDASILVGAGSTLWLPQLMLEILDHKLTPDRLSIDPQAIVIDDADRRAETAGLASIGTTAQGVGAAASRKILNRGSTPLFGPPVTLARDVKQLSKFVRDTRAELDTLFRKGVHILLEGTQGTALSIHHGIYPHVTSRETSTSGCLADAGIAHARVRNVIMTVRTYPIRVESPANGTSGWMGREIEFKTIAERSGIPESELIAAEKGTVSGRLRRIAEFDWAQLRRATEINGASEIALTFVDYLGIDNRHATKFSELNAEAQDFIRKVGAVAGVPVTLVSKAFADGGVLDRGAWT